MCELAECVHRECSIFFRSLCVDNVEFMLFICKFHFDVILMYPFFAKFKTFLRAFRLDSSGINNATSKENY